MMSWRTDNKAVRIESMNARVLLTDSVNREILRCQLAEYTEEQTRPRKLPISSFISSTSSARTHLFAFDERNDGVWQSTREDMSSTQNISAELD